MGAVAPIAIRVNPDVDARTHAKIATGKAENKFGVPIGRARAVYAEAARLPGIEVVGDRRAHRQPADRARALRGGLRQGGGADAWRCAPTGTTSGGSTSAAASASRTGASNEAPPLPFDYGEVVRRTVGHLGCEIEIEPGRLIAGNAGVLLARVIYLKHGEGRDFLILDAAMNDLIRPAMYDAWHDIVPVVEPAAGRRSSRRSTWSGRSARPATPSPRRGRCRRSAPGDLVAFRSAGAYGAVMASEYNSRPLVPEVLVHGDHFAVVRARPSFDEMLEARYHPGLDRMRHA